jgi:hypothetical protein
VARTFPERSFSAEDSSTAQADRLSERATSNRELLDKQVPANYQQALT